MLSITNTSKTSDALQQSKNSNINSSEHTADLENNAITLEEIQIQMAEYLEKKRPDILYSPREEQESSENLKEESLKATYKEYPFDKAEVLLLILEMTYEGLCGHHGWIKFFYNNFSTDDLEMWTKKGLPTASMICIILHSNLENKIDLVTTLLNSRNSLINDTYSGGQVITSKGHLTHRGVATTLFIGLLNLTIENPTSTLLQQYLKKLREANNQTRFRAQPFHNGKINDISILTILLTLNRGDIARKLCSDFSFDANCLSATDNQKKLTPLEHAIISDNITLSTYHEWLNTDKLNYAIANIRLSNLSIVGCCKIILLLDKQPKALSHEQTDDFSQALLKHINKQEKLAEKQTERLNDISRTESDFTLLGNNKLDRLIWDFICQLEPRQIQDIAQNIFTYNYRLRLLDTIINSTHQTENQQQIYNFLLELFGKGFNISNKKANANVIEKIQSHPDSDLYEIKTKALEALLSFTQGEAPQMLIGYNKNSDASDRLLNSKETIILNSAYLFCRNHCGIRNGVFKKAKEQSIIYLLTQASLYNGNNARNSLNPELAYRSAWNITDIDIISLRITQLENLLTDEVALITAKRTNMDGTGAESENIIKKIIMTLAFRKLYLSVKDIPGLDESSLINNTTREPCYQQFTKTHCQESIIEIVDALKNCQEIIRKHKPNVGTFTKVTTFGKHHIDHEAALQKIINQLDTKEANKDDLIEGERNAAKFYDLCL